MPLVDWQISHLIKEHEMIDPFDVANLSSMGYDLSLDRYFKVPIQDAEEQIIDPFNPPNFLDKICEEYIIIPPHGFVLGCTLERIRMPNSLIGICLGRSTYARSGVISHVTPIEPGWEGYITIEVSNTNPLPVKVWIGKGITQVVFFEADTLPSRDYVAKGGRYQNQARAPVQGKSSN